MEKDLFYSYSSSMRWAGPMCYSFSQMRKKELRGQGTPVRLWLVGLQGNLRLDLLPSASPFTPTHSLPVFMHPLGMCSVLYAGTLCWCACVHVGVRFLETGCSLCNFYAHAHEHALGVLVCPEAYKAHVTQRGIPSWGFRCLVIPRSRGFSISPEPQLVRKIVLISGTDPQAGGMEQKNQPAMLQ